jgi:hypothetical protein
MWLGLPDTISVLRARVMRPKWPTAPP